REARAAEIAGVHQRRRAGFCGIEARHNRLLIWRVAHAIQRADKRIVRGIRIASDIRVSGRTERNGTAHFAGIAARTVWRTAEKCGVYERVWRRGIDAGDESISADGVLQRGLKTSVGGRHREIGGLRVTGDEG